MQVPIIRPEPPTCPAMSSPASPQRQHTEVKESHVLPKSSRSATAVTRTAALGAGALLLGMLALPAAASAPAPAAVGALAGVSASPYSAFSSGDIVYANAADLPPVDVAKASTGQSAAGAALHGATLT